MFQASYVLREFGKQLKLLMAHRIQHDIKCYIVKKVIGWYSFTDMLTNYFKFSVL